MGAVIDTLICWLIWIVKSGGSMFVDGIKLVLYPIAALANAAVALLPETAVDRPDALTNSTLGTMNYFLPIGPLAAQALILIAAWGIYRLYRYLFKWVA